MKIRIAGLCLVAMFAMAALAAASASAALPEFYECHKGAKGSGEFSDKKCSNNVGAGKGLYTLQPGVGKGKAFKGKGGTATLHTPAVKAEVSCKSLKGSGKMTSPTQISNVVVTFTSCVSLGKKCTTPAQKPGTIKTNPMKAGLGYISKSPLKVGTNLSAESGTRLAEFVCEGLEINVTGSVIGEISPVNTFSKVATSTYAILGDGSQAVKKYESGPTEILQAEINGSGPFESGQQATAVNKGEELDIKA